MRSENSRKSIGSVKSSGYGRPVEQKVNRAFTPKGGARDDHRQRPDGAVNGYIYAQNPALKNMKN